MNLITLENISKSYSEKKLVENISLGINDKEKIGLIGVNGTGKSTLLKIIAGAEIPDDGTITKANKVRIEYLPQNPYYDEDATVLEQVFKGTCEEMKIIGDYQDILDKINKSYDEKLNEKLLNLQEKMDALNLWDLESSAKTVLTKLGIKDFNQKVKELSGGQRKRVSLASALITPCELLILDEPTAGLDPISTRAIVDIIKGLNDRGVKIIISSHDMNLIYEICDYVYVLNQGVLINEGTRAEVFVNEEKINEAGLELPWLVKLHKNMGLPLFPKEEDLYSFWNKQAQKTV